MCTEGAGGRAYITLGFLSEEGHAEQAGAINTVMDGAEAQLASLPHGQVHSQCVRMVSTGGPRVLSGGATSSVR